MSYTNILYTVENSICTITINRPDKLNALNKDTIAEIGIAIASAQKDHQVRGIILTGAGSERYVSISPQSQSPYSVLSNDDFPKGRLEWFPSRYRKSREGAPSPFRNS